jgi:hypothetical protein
MLLRCHLLGKLEVVRMWGNVGHLSLHRKIGRELLLWLYHAHANILLVGCGNVLLLLL